MFNRIAEFHRAFGHPVADTPCLPEQSIRNLRVSLLNEELGEFCAAHREQNRVEMADGLADMAVIIAGTMVAYGIVPGDGHFDSPYEDGCEAPVDGADPNALPLRLVQSFNHYALAEFKNDLNEIKSTLMTLLMDVCGTAFNLRIPLNAVFAEVHRSNMSKIMPDGSVRYRSDGKIQKPDNWQPPNIEAILAAYDDV